MEKYTKIRVLGKGSFGSAILIKRRSDNALLVIKEVFIGKMSRKEREEARQECRVLQQLNHPNIVRYVEHFEQHNNLYIVMEYCDGGDLHAKLKSGGPMKEKTILYYYSQVCLAMEYLHSRHILHRDIKTMNVFLMKNGSAKLGDFGIATVLRSTMGMANTVCGTPYYFSPEICRNKPYNNKSDVWALGVLLYELATGRHPFDGSSMQQLMQRIVKGTFAPLPKHFSPEFHKMVDWCLQKDPARRPTIKQTLSLPIVRHSLEELEENLMLATQCRVRLRDIMDFDVGLNDDNSKQRGVENKIRSSPSQEVFPVGRPSHPHSPSPEPVGLSPGRAAALAVAEQQEQEQEKQKKLQQQRQPLTPRRQALLGPKPATAGMAGVPMVDHNRIDNYRRYLQQQYQQQGAPTSTPTGNDGCGTPVPLSPISPARQQVRQQQPQKKDRNGVQDVDARNIPVGEHQKRVNEGEGGGDVFKERMQRIDAIMQRYGQNVDPNARETIHAYMKRKQEEYAQRQRSQQECNKRRAELRRRELAKVIEYQNKVAHEDAQHNQQKKVANLKPNVLPVYSVDVSPSSPVKQQRRQQQQQQRPAVFGRDPRFVQRAARELDPLPSQKGNQSSNCISVPNRGRASKSAQKGEKVVAANSPRVLAPPGGRQNPVEMSPRNGGVRVAQTAASRNAPLGNNNNKNDLKPVSPSSLAAGRSGLPVPSRGIKDLDGGVSLQQQQQNIQVMNRVITIPVANTPSTVGNSNLGEVKNIEAKKCKKIAIASRPSPNILERRNSDPLRHFAEAPRFQKGTSLNDLPTLEEKHMIRPTAAAGFMPLNLVKQDPPPSQQQPGPLRLSNSASGTPGFKSPFYFISRNDVPAAVEARYRLEQHRRQVVPLTEVKLELEERPAKADVIINTHSIETGMEEKGVIINNNKKRMNNPSQEIDEKAQFPPSTLAAISGDNNTDVRPRAKNVPPPLALGPLHVRPVQMVFPQRISPPKVPLSQAVGGPTVPFARVMGKQLILRSNSNNSKGSLPLQPTAGIVPAVIGVKVSPQVRAPTAGILAGARSDGVDTQNGDPDELPVLLDVDYGVLVQHQDDMVKQTTPTTSTCTAQLPIIMTGDGVAGPPEVAQQWRNILETNGNHRIAYRAPFVQVQGSAINGAFVLNENSDVLAAYQKVNQVRASIPSTLEALRSFRDNKSEDFHSHGEHRPGLSLILQKLRQQQEQQQQQRQEQQNSSPALRCVLPSSLPVPLSLEAVVAQPQQEQQELSEVIVNKEEVSSSASEGTCSSSEKEEERAALIALVEGVQDTSGDDDTEQGETSIASIDGYQEKSLDGYLAMLDHLQNVLRNPRRGKRFESQAERRKKKLESLSLLPPVINEEVLEPHELSIISSCIDLPTPRHLMNTKVNCPGKETLAEVKESEERKRSEEREDKNEKEPENQDEESDQINYHTDMEDDDYVVSGDEEEDDDDKDFEDAVPLSPVRCATLNDTYRRLLENARFIPVEILLDGPCGEALLSGGDTIGVDTNDGAETQRVTGRSNADITENFSFLDGVTGEIENDDDSGYTMYV